jgi:predicted dehydrogenase
MTRRTAVKVAGAAAVAAPFIGKVRGANNQVQFGMIGTGSRGTYLLKHLAKIDNGRCVALCDLRQEGLDLGVKTIGTNPKTFKDYRELLAQKDVEAVFVTTPLYLHFPITKDALQSGKHVFCEKSMVHRPEEVSALRTLAHQHSKQTLQVGLQRRYSRFYEAVKDMIDKKVLGDVKHIHCQWHRNMINKPSNLWTMKPGGKNHWANWRLYRDFSGGIVAELTSHQVDVADWMFGSTPEFVMGLGGLDTLTDGRDVYDNVQLIYKYSGGRKMTYSSVSTNSHLPLFNSTRSEMGEMIMGTDGTIHITVGDDNNPAIAWWYREPPKAQVDKAKTETAKVAGATMVAGPASKPIPIIFDDLKLTGQEGFIEKELKFARRWLYSKGVLVQEEQRNPVDTELESFFQSCRDGKKPKADVEVGLADSTAVILSNLAMDQERRIYFNEIDKIGGAAAAPAKKRS